MSFFDDFLGKKKSKKQVKRERFEDSKDRGARAQTIFEIQQMAMGNVIKRAPRGHDYRVESFNPRTWRWETTYHEVKTPKAPLSPLQKKTKKRMGRKYKVDRIDPDIL